MTTLYHTIITFFEQKMSEHSMVRQFMRNVAVSDEHIYRIERKDTLSDVIVFLSDAYRFGLADYLGRPSCIRRGDFILVARPEADFDISIIGRAKKDGIGIGKIGKLMGALNFRNPSDYVMHEKKK